MARTKFSDRTPAQQAFRFTFLISALVVWLVWGLASIPAVSDHFEMIFYRPTEKIQELQDSISLTNEGKRIWSAVDPEYKPAAEFNELCDSHDESVYVLGCYIIDNDKIYLYEVTSEQLVDANKVTVAHELLHAAWERLSSSEQAELTRELVSFYGSNQTWFDSELESYDDEERIGEIYTRAATKLADLPESLESHYARFFENRQQIVEYYNNYHELFDSLTTKMDELDEKLTTLDAEIERGREEYRSGIESLNREIDEFNDCADREGCFTEATFNTRRAELVQENGRLDAQLATLNQKIEQYNQLVDEYQEISSEIGDLYNQLNSQTVETNLNNL